MVQFLGKVGGTYTTYYFCGSTATALAESGIGVMGLYYADHWKSLTTTQEYTEHSNVEKQDRVDKLEPTENHTTAVVTRTAVTTVVTKRKRVEVNTAL